MFNHYNPINKMNELVSKINELFEKFSFEADKNIYGNKAAGVRARKISLEIEKTLKEYRKKSVV